MGYIFEEIIRRFSEAHNEDAGQHYTPREVIELMVNILFYDDNDVLSGNNVAKTIYDPACGTGGMLSVAEEYLHRMNATTELMAFGQEINDQTFAICKADMLIKGNNAEFIKDGNTLTDDQFEGQTFDYILSNPPFGREWKNEKAKVEAEAKLGFAGRFGAGLPAANDGQMLFLLTAISKMKDPKDGGSRIAIIHNGSPLFTGDAGSGPSDIRKYILENDLLEATILQFRIPVPPVAEQQEIVDYLDIRCTKINQSIKGCKIIIDKLTEYKRSLIYEVVTGKKEV
ncbi:MAG: N-6 DNA methylase [Enterocloster bolteae]|uniref:N-6 DNA methylase n=1 Tax=Enterocloster bolteae TaxID=208479 RepID=UPI0039919E1C